MCARVRLKMSYTPNWGFGHALFSDKAILHWDWGDQTSPGHVATVATVATIATVATTKKENGSL